MVEQELENRQFEKFYELHAFLFHQLMTDAAPQVSADGPITIAGKLYTRTRRHRIRYPKNFDPNSRSIVTVPDPHRWLPRSQRPGQSRRKAAGPSFIRGPQGLISTEERRPAGPSTAHIDLKSGATKKKKGRK